MKLRYLLVVVVLCVCGTFIYLNLHPRREFIKRIEESCVNIASISMSLGNEQVEITDAGFLKMIEDEINRSNFDLIQLDHAKWLFGTADLHLIDPDYIVEDVVFYVNYTDKMFCMAFYINKADDELPVGFYMPFSVIADSQLLSFINRGVE